MHEVDHSIKGKKLVIAIILNLIITIGQFVGGIISGSISLISDALHNFSDVMALIISYIATGLLKKKNTISRTFGFQRAEIIAAFINASSLIAIAIFLCFEAARRFSEPVTIESTWVIIFASVSILLNGASVLILHSEARLSLNIKSVYIHLLTDMFTSIAVLVGGVLMVYYKIFWIDSVLTLMIAAYLIYSTWSILIESLKVLMLFTPAHIDPLEISNRVCTLTEVENIHHVHVWQLNEDTIHFEAHVDFKSNVTLVALNGTFDKIRQMLLTEFNIHHVTLQPELNTCNKNDLIAESH
jgi:cobalt-zinc-cadmium efflux system protein